MKHINADILKRALGDKEYNRVVEVYKMVNTRATDELFEPNGNDINATVLYVKGEIEPKEACEIMNLHPRKNNGYCRMIKTVRWLYENGQLEGVI